MLDVTKRTLNHNMQYTQLVLNCLQLPMPCNQGFMLLLQLYCSFVVILDMAKICRQLEIQSCGHKDPKILDDKAAIVVTDHFLKP